ncbi:MAG: diguanylate cyclase [Candidatus Omnitrophica bacterium]|nr:diguanylate cyclase [Candidatus Omnitrophota bacterium]
MSERHSTDPRILIWCAVLLTIFFISDLMFQWTAGGILYVLVIILALRSSKDRYVYFFAGLTSVLLILSWRLSPSVEKVWHASIIIIWVTAISGLRFKKEGIIKSSLAAIVDSSLDAIIGKTLNNIVISWNKAAEHLLGYNREEIVGHSDYILIPEGRLYMEQQLLDEVKEGKEIKHYQTIRLHKDGHMISVALTLSPIKDPFGNIVGISSIAQDITERIAAEKKLEELNDQIALERKKIRKVLSIEEHLNTIFDMDKLIDFVVNKTTEVLEAEKCSVIIVDYDTRELCIKGHKGIEDKFVTGKELIAADSISGLIAREAGPVLVLDIESDHRFSRKNRVSYHSKSFMSVPIKLGSSLMGFINVADKNSDQGNVFSDLDLKILCMIVRQVAVAIENAKLYRDLQHLTITDPLTDIYNFRYFTRTLDHEILRLKRHPSRPLCLFMIDVDNFKSYNDTFGHLAGDSLLQMMSKVLTKSVREIDIVCRYAGDEFAVILPETDALEANMVAERIKRSVDDISLKRKVTVSIGIAKCTEHNTNRYELIQSADIALSKAKQSGKNLVYSFNNI